MTRAPHPGRRGPPTFWPGAARELRRTLLPTALLCGALGLLLYVLLSSLAEVPGFALLLGLGGACVLTLLTMATARHALRTGVYPVWPRPIARAGAPLAFWGSVAWTLVFAGASGVLAVFCAVRLAGALAGG